MWDHMQGYGQGYGFMGFGGFFGIIFWLLIIVGIVLAVKWIAGTSAGGARQSPSAMEILKQRYASGEISEEQYQRMKKEIEGRE